MSVSTPAPLSASAVAALPDDAALLKRMLEEVLASLQQVRSDNESLRHRLDTLLRRLYGPRSERCDPSQRLLFALATEAEAAATTEAAAEAATAKRRCRPHGRRRLPTDLPRQECQHQLTEAERQCPTCGELRIDIGVDTSEQLEYRPASLFVVAHQVHKYACPGCRRAASAAPPAPAQEEAPRMAKEQAPDAAPVPTATPPASPTAQAAATEPGVVVSAVKPASPIAKGLPGPGLLAHLIVSKYTDHLPLYRLERIYERQGVFLHRSTLSDWLAACAALLRPLYERMVAVVLASRALHTDDTTVKMQEPLTHLLSTARLWVYYGDQAHPYNVFDFTLNRKRDGPEKFLAGYQGYLHADAFSGYERLYLPPAPAAPARIIEVACNAHARRKFYAARETEPLRAHQALAYYRQLYALEGPAKDFGDEQRLQMRKDFSVPILERFQQWLQQQRADVLPKSPLGEAVAYALNNWTALARYTEAGYLAIDNNVAEREMKRIAIGRKNWLSVGSPRGGQTAAVLFSFTSTCQRLAVEPWAYLQDVLTRLPELPAEQLDSLLPDRWEAARRARATAATASATTENPPSTGPVS